MTNLKRVLSLALAAVMLMGMMVIGAGAANVEYTDAESIENAEAVEVLTALDVLGGYPDGSFKPEGTITRAEAAAIICRIMLGADVAESLSTDTAPFADVKATNWAAGYLAYLKNLGVISGIGNNKFNPQGTVTVGEFAKMLLGAAGIDGKYTGSSWLINVTVAAQKAGILDNTDKVTDAATRDAAAGYTFNTLNAGEETTKTSAKYVIEVLGTAPGSYEGSYGLADFQKLGGTYYDTYNAAEAAVDTVSKAAIYGTNYRISVMNLTITAKEDSLGYTVFGLESAQTTDDFGLPTTTWTQNGKELAEFANEATLTYTSEVSEATIFAALGLKKAVAGATISVNGAAATPATLAYNGGNIAASGNGVKLSVYYDAKANTVAMYTVDTYYGVVKNVTPATAVTAETVTIDTSLTGGPNVGDKSYEISGLKVNTPVLYTYSAKTGVAKITSLQTATAIEVTPNSYSGNKSFTAAGTTYEYSDNFTGTRINAFNAVKIYLDNYGYVITTGNVQTTSNYAVFLQSTTITNWPNPSSISAQILKADGTVAIVENVKSVDGLAEGDIVTYADGTGADAGKVILTEVAAGTPAGATGNNAAGSADIDKGTVAFELGSTNLKANANTIFLVKTVKDTVASYAVYVGIANVPSISASTDSAYYDKAGDGYADIVYVDTATLVSAPTVSDTIIYVDASSKVQYNDATLGEYSVYTAVVDGTITTIKTTKDLITADAIIGKVTTNDKGLISVVTNLSGEGIALVTTPVTSTTAAKDGVVKLGSAELTYTDSTVVYKVTADGITASSVAAIGTDANDTVVYYTTNGVLTAAYITVVD